MKKILLYFALVLALGSLVIIVYAAKTRKWFFGKQYQSYLQHLNQDVQDALEKSIGTASTEAHAIGADGLTQKLFVSYTLGEDTRRFVADFQKKLMGMKYGRKIQVVNKDGKILMSTLDREADTKKLSQDYLTVLKEHFAIHPRRPHVLFQSNKTNFIICEKFPRDSESDEIIGYVLTYFDTQRILEPFGGQNIQLAGTKNNRIFLTTKKYSPEQINATLSRIDEFPSGQKSKEDFLIRLRINGVVAAYDINSKPYRPWIAILMILVNMALLGLVVYALIAYHNSDQVNNYVQQNYDTGVDMDDEFAPLPVSNDRGYESPSRAAYDIPPSDEIRGLVRDIERGKTYAEGSGNQGIENMIMNSDTDFTTMPGMISSDEDDIAGAVGSDDFDAGEFSLEDIDLDQPLESTAFQSQEDFKDSQDIWDKELDSSAAAETDFDNTFDDNSLVERFDKVFEEKLGVKTTKETRPVFDSLEEETLPEEPGMDWEEVGQTTEGEAMWEPPTEKDELEVAASTYEEMQLPDGGGEEAMAIDLGYSTETRVPTNNQLETELFAEQDRILQGIDEDAFQSMGTEEETEVSDEDEQAMSDISFEEGELDLDSLGQTPDMDFGSEEVVPSQDLGLPEIQEENTAEEMPAMDLDLEGLDLDGIGTDSGDLGLSELTEELESTDTPALDLSGMDLEEQPADASEFSLEGNTEAITSDLDLDDLGIDNNLQAASDSDELDLSSLDLDNLDTEVFETLEKDKIEGFEDNEDDGVVEIDDDLSILGEGPAEEILSGEDLMQETLIDQPQETVITDIDLPEDIDLSSLDEISNLDIEVGDDEHLVSPDQQQVDGDSIVSLDIPDLEDIAAVQEEGETNQIEIDLPPTEIESGDMTSQDIDMEIPDLAEIPEIMDLDSEKGLLENEATDSEVNELDVSAISDLEESDILDVDSLVAQVPEIGSEMNDDEEIALSMDELSNLDVEIEEDAIPSGDNSSLELDLDIDDLINSVPEVGEEGEEDNISLDMDELNNLESTIDINMEEMVQPEISESPFEPETETLNENVEPVSDNEPTLEDLDIDRLMSSVPEIEDIVDNDEGDISLSMDDLSNLDLDEETNMEVTAAEIFPEEVVSVSDQDLEQISQNLNNGSNQNDFEDIFGAPPVKLSSITNVEEYAAVAQDLAKNSLKMSKVAIYKKQGEDFVSILNDGFESEVMLDVKDPVLSRYIEKHKSIDIRGDLENTRYLKERFSTQDLKDLSELLIVPIVHGEEVNGLALFGRKKGDAEPTNFQKSELHNLGFLQEN